MTFPERNHLHNLDPVNFSARHYRATAWFAEHFGAALPRGLREQADAMSWDSFVAIYGRGAGPRS